MKPRIGNDLIDLDAAHNRGRAANPRLLSRVLGAGERQWLADSGAGDEGFAMLWSAKEAAYKALKKARPEQVFAPGRWQVDTAALPKSDRLLRTAGVVHHGCIAIDARTVVALCWRRHRHWLHCLALLGPAPTVLDSAVCTLDQERPQAAFTARERAGFVSAESAAVRRLAKRLLHRHGLHAVEIVRPPQGRSLSPPRVLCAGAPAPGTDLSLSHDGRFLAAAVALFG